MRSNFRILVIEDETTIRVMIRDILASGNYEVLEADSGEEGLKSVFFGQPDLILCDVVMPGMDGYEVLRTLRQVPATRGIPFIFLTARSTREETRRGMNAGADDYLSKPFGEEELLSAIESRLAQRIAIGLGRGRLPRNTRPVPPPPDNRREELGTLTLENTSCRRLKEGSLLRAELVRALDGEGLKVYYQPQFSIASGEITGAEALVRWPHPQLGAISPAEFIPLAERTGSIGRLGRWVLHTACHQWQTWRSFGLKLPRLAVNLSARQFERARFQRDLTKILKMTGIPPGALELELTEGTLIRDMGSAIERFDALKQLGVKIAIDDFGTGYSSLGYLHRLSFDTLKIDRVFIQDIDRNLKNAVIVQTLIEMAHQLDLTVIAEGVEREEEFTFLRVNGCDEIQGFFCGPPVPAPAFEKRLRESPRSGAGAPLAGGSVQ